MENGQMPKSKDELAAYAREYRARNLEKKRAYEKEYYDKNPDKAKEKRRKYNANWLAKNPNANRNKHYKKRYGITVEDYEAMSERQNHLCAICGLPETKKRKDGTTSILAVDHDHTTGAVRELLCVGCNHMLGNIENRNVSLDAIAAYIKRHSEVAQ
jgi:hypothetical protein